MSAPGAQGAHGSAQVAPEVPQLARIIALVAQAAGVSGQQLRDGSHVRGLSHFRYLAVVLCLQVPGVDKRRLARTFQFNPSSLRVFKALVVHRMEADGAYREVVHDLCRQLQLVVPQIHHDPDEIDPSLRLWIAEIWEAVGIWGGISGVALLASRRKEHRSLQWLAITLSLELPGVTSTQLSKMLGFSYPTCRDAERNLQRVLERRPEFEELRTQLRRDIIRRHDVTE